MSEYVTGNEDSLFELEGKRRGMSLHKEELAIRRDMMKRYQDMKLLISSLRQ
jgi:hypothetical protein